MSKTLSKILRRLVARQSNAICACVSCLLSDYISHVHISHCQQLIDSVINLYIQKEQLILLDDEGHPSLLTKDECLRSQIATLNEGRGQHLKYMPYVFTENGVAMLSSVLRSDPDGCGDYYTNKGICLGTDKKNNNSRTPLSSSNL